MTIHRCSHTLREIPLQKQCQHAYLRRGLSHHLVCSSPTRNIAQCSLCHPQSAKLINPLPSLLMMPCTVCSRARLYIWKATIFPPQHCHALPALTALQILREDCLISMPNCSFLVFTGTYITLTGENSSNMSPASHDHLQGSQLVQASCCRSATCSPASCPP
jgi:hypothetical protein